MLIVFFFFSSRRRHTRLQGDWSSDVCTSDLPGTGAVSVKGTLDGRRLDLTVETPSGKRTESRELAAPPALSLNLSRRLAAEGLATGQHHELAVFDPATLRNAPMSLDVEAREIVRA